MRWSTSHLFTLKDSPNDAEIPSHKLMIRAGMIRRVAPGIYTYGTLALRSLRKLEQIIREELDSRGCQEILMPMVHPADLWKETNRWTEMGEGLLKFKNRNDQDFCLGATHEEVVTDFVRKDLKSYRDLPRNLYQIQTKYRDEIRPRFGLMRGREFIMKDAYSFDADEAGALVAYDKMYSAYKAIFTRSGLNFRIVQADAGNIGGSKTHEFQVLADSGEDHLMVCDKCDFAANIEVAPKKIAQPIAREAVSAAKLEKFATPQLKTIADLAKALKTDARNLVKTLFFSANPRTNPKDQSLQPIAVCVPGDFEVNPIKLKNLLGLPNPPLMLTDQEVKEVTGAAPGSCGPVGLKIPIYADAALTQNPERTWVVGANEDDFHLKGVLQGRDFKITQSADLCMASAGDLCPSCNGGKYNSVRGIEVGHVFYLGRKYSVAMGANFLAADGSSVPLEMGCYGIGVSRTVQSAIEQNFDQDGIVWPKSLAPFAVQLLLLDPDQEEVKQCAEVLYRDLKAHGFDVLLDDRAERPGVKFKDADLLGMPIRINVGARGLKEGVVELVARKTKQMQKVKAEDCLEAVQALWSQLT